MQIVILVVPSSKFDMGTADFDVVVIGGSYAGLSAAMALGRSLRKVLIIDNGKPCNRMTPHSHNFLTQDGEKPAVISLKAKEQVLRYPSVKIMNDQATTVLNRSSIFEIATVANVIVTARKLILATGVTDTMPDIKGFEACWGNTVIHCPYCHGYEFRDQATGIMANGDRAIHLAGMVYNLTKKVFILTSGKAEFTEEQLTQLRKNGITIIEEKITEIVHHDGIMETIVFEKGETLALQAMYAALPFVQHSGIPVQLGCELTETGHIKTDQMQRTSVENVFACGDNCIMMRSVAASVASGNMAGAIANNTLCLEEF